MVRHSKIVINTDIEQAKRSREWQAAKCAKKNARKAKQAAIHESQRLEALASGVKTKHIAPNISGKSKLFRQSPETQLKAANFRIEQLEATIAKLTKWAKHDFYDSQAWQSLRYQALSRANGCCELCGQSKSDGVIIQVDHIKPRSKFPHLELDLNNLQVLCKPCNLGKSNKDSTDWRKPVLKVVSG